MGKRLDEIFSVEKLRRSWEGTAEPAPPTAGVEETITAPDDGASAAQTSYRRLLATIERCFSPACAAALAPLLEELEQLLNRRFPAGESAAMPRAERLELTMAVDGLLNQIEDLLEAFEAGATRQGRSEASLF